MRPNSLRGMTGGLGAALVLLLTSLTPVHGDFTPPSQPAALIGEAFAFVNDFSSWNASHSGLPMDFLAIAPAAEQGEALFMLFWLWLLDQHGMPGSSDSSSSHPSGNPISNPPSSSPPHGPVDSSIGSIVLDSTTNKHSSSVSNGDVSPLLANGSNAGDDHDHTTPSPASFEGASVPPVSGSSTGNDPSSSRSPGSGDDSPVSGSNSGNSISNSNEPPVVLANGGSNAPPVSGSSIGVTPPASLVNGNGDDSPSGGSAVGSNNVILPPVSWGNSGNTLGQNDPPLGIGGGSNGQSASSDPISGTVFADSDPMADAVPEPAGFTLLAIGGIGLLVGRRTRSRKA